MTSFETSFRNRYNNFDFMRMLAAVMVVFSHSFPLALGKGGFDPLSMLTLKRESFGSLGVTIFFVISGFLISHSFNRQKSPLIFLRNRFLRMAPALWVVIFLSACVMGPLITTDPHYWQSPLFYEYFKNLMFFKRIYHFLPGVFEHNILQPMVNGSLWTIPVECKSYVVLLGLGMLGAFRFRYVLFPLFIYALLHDTNFYNLFRYFCAGVLLYAFRDSIHMSWRYALVSCFVIIAGIYLNVLTTVLPLFGGYLILYLCLHPSVRLQNFGKYGDFSYGIYIYAWPIQQLIVQFHPYGMNPYQLFFTAMPLILVCAVISWHLIEKPCLNWKRGRRPSAPVAAVPQA